ncbi:MAG: hypothetical protein ACR2HG_01350 [Pyrinomonadaceae bacterium]
MRFYILLFTTIFLIGCGGTETSNSSTNTKPANTNVAATGANNPLATTKTPEASTTNNAPTLAPVVQNYYAALQKKDEAGAKKFLSQSAIAYWQAEMKTDKSTSLLAVLEDDAYPVEEKREVRNEKIEGDAGIAEIKGGSLGNWTPIKFVKENGEWKFASPKESLALQDIPKTSANNGAAK